MRTWKLLELLLFFHKYLLENKIYYAKQFGFQVVHSTDHAIIQLVDQIFQAYENNLSTLGVFIDLSKAFETVDHKILLKKLELYGIRDNNHNWIKNYLSKRNNKNPTTKTSLEQVQCGVPQLKDQY